MGQKQNIVKTNFSSGEVTPLLRGRVDVTRNKNGAERIENFTIRPQGTLARRMGTKFLTPVRDSANRTYLIPFQFSDSQTYTLEVGVNYIRILKDGVYLLNEFLRPYRVQTPYLAGDLHAITYCQSADVLYLTHPKYYPRTLLRFSESDWQLKKLVHQDGPYRAQEDDDKNTTLWLRDILHRAILTSTEADFSLSDEGKFVEYYDEGFLVLGKITEYLDDYRVRIEPQTNVVDFADLDKKAVLHYTNSGGTPRIRSSLAIWSSETENCYLKVRGSIWRFMTTHQAAPESVGTAPDVYSADVMLVDDSKQPTMVAVTGEITTVREYISAVLKASDSIFSDPRDIGRHFRLTLSGRNVWGWISTIDNGKTATVKLGTPVPLDWKGRNKYLDDTRTTNWRLGAWYQNNYPSYVAIFQQRLVFACTTFEPNRLWFSETDNFVSFAVSNKYSEVLDSSGFTVQLGGFEVNAIRWIQPTQVLLVGTAGEEFQIKPSSIAEPLTPTNHQIITQTAYGSRPYIRPIKIGAATLFVQRHGQTLRELQYNFDIDSFVARDLTIVAEHIIRQNTRAIQMAYVQVPYTMLWVLCANGRLLSFTYEKEHEVFAWAQHSIGSGIVESMCVIPAKAGLRDDLYLIVRRTINGKIRRYIEVMSPDFLPVSENDKIGMLYLDSAIEYSGTPVTRVGNLAHLEGRTIGVLANHAVHPPCVVHNGVIDLQYAASHIYAGELFTSYVKTLPMDEGSQAGSGLGKLGKVVKVDLQVHNSIGCKFGRTIDAQRIPKSMMPTEQIMGQSPPLQTTFVELTDDGGFSKDRQFFIVQDQPYPLNILSLTSTIVVNE